MARTPRSSSVGVGIVGTVFTATPPERTKAARATSSSAVMGARLSRTSTGRLTAAVTSVLVWSMTSSAPAVLTCFAAARAGCGDHVSAGVFGELHGVAADRSAGAVDQHALARRQPGVVKERLPCGEGHHRHGGGLGERDGLGRWRQDLGWRDDVLG